MGTSTNQEKHKVTVLIIEDDPDIGELVQYNLEREGIRVLTSRDGELGFREVIARKPSLVILDLMLPGMDGLQVCRMIRQTESTKTIPIIMLTAKGEESDRILGLGLGADDYLAKPFSPKELVARVHALLRRVGWSHTEGSGDRLESGPVSIDSFRHEVFLHGEAMTLTLSEFRLLKSLVSNAGRVLSREQLLDRMTGGESIVIDRNVDVHIGAIRKKMGSDGDLISTIRGVGYKFKD